MTDPSAHSWAFVVQFDSADRTAGRAEHIASGRRRQFQSAWELLRFLTGEDQDDGVDGTGSFARTEWPKMGKGTR